MAAPLRLSGGPPPRRRDAIGAWLDTLGVLLRLPPPQRSAICEELEGHLRERVRDLMLAGMSEPDAVRTAIGELGDAAVLAERLSAAARRPRRRLAMNVALFGMAGAAFLTSVVAWQQAGGPGPAGNPASGPVASAEFLQPPESEPGKFQVALSPQMNFADFTAQLAQKAGMPVVVRWKLLEEVGAGQDSALPVEVSLDKLPLREAFRLINEGFAPANDGLDFRVHDGRLVLATTAYFDKREVVLVAYDISPQARERARQYGDTPQADATARVAEDIANVIRSLVYSELWNENGGDRASIAVYGSKLFIRAPRRFHPEIEWVLGQLSSPQPAAAGGPPLLDDVPLLTRVGEGQSTAPAR